MTSEDWVKVFQALGYGGTFAAFVAFFVVKYAWPHYLDRVAKADKAKEEALKAREDDLNKFLGHLETRDQNLGKALTDLRTSQETRDRELSDALKLRNDLLVEVLKALATKLQVVMPGEAKKRRRTDGG